MSLFLSLFFSPHKQRTGNCLQLLVPTQLLQDRGVKIWCNLQLTAALKKTNYCQQLKLLTTVSKSQLPPSPLDPGSEKYHPNSLPQIATLSLGSLRQKRPQAHFENKTKIVIKKTTSIQEVSFLLKHLCMDSGDWPLSKRMKIPCGLCWVAAKWNRRDSVEPRKAERGIRKDRQPKAIQQQWLLKLG